MEREPTRVLLVEDDRDDYLIARELLSEIEGNRFHLDWVDSYDAGLRVMGESRHDVYLLDYRLNGHTGLDLLREARLQGCQGPIIVLTGQGEREVDLEAMKAGAADYLVKGEIGPLLLERSLRYAIERHRDREALRRAHDELEKRVQDRTLELEKANEALRQADHHKDEFLAMLAHELRNPLAPIRTGLHVLRMPGHPGHDSLDAGRIMQMMDHEIGNLTRLVDELLDVSRITRGKIQLRKETVDLAATVAHAVETVRPLIEAQRHRLTISLPPEPIHLEADPTRLEQVLANLLTNAAKYTEQSGHIELTVERAGGEIVLRVRDNGLGISAELLPRVFDMFSQGDRSLARSNGGMGIGLTLVRKLVQMHGGSVSAHSDGPGKGSEFVVRLFAAAPGIAPAALVAPLTAGAAEPSPGNRLRVLIVEDSETVAETLRLMMELWGHQVRTASDGPTALVAARTFQPDVVLLDIGLPGMNGYDVARQLRGQHWDRQPRIAAVTGYGQAEDRRRSQEAGFDQHFVKPIDPAALAEFMALAEPGGKMPVPRR